MFGNLAGMNGAFPGNANALIYYLELLLERLDHLGPDHPLRQYIEDLLERLGGHEPSKFDGLKDLRARNSDGHDNDGDGNDDNDRGYHEDTFVRVTPAAYPDGSSLPNQLLAESNIDWDNYDAGDYVAPAGVLPSARDVSNAVMAQGDANIPSEYGLNEFHQFFGQLLTHDMAEAALGRGGPFPPDGIPGPIGGIPFPSFARTPFEDGTGTSAGNPREQINEETSFLDLSMVYGNREELTELFRMDVDGQQSAYLLMGDDNMLPTIGEVADNAGMDPFDVFRAFTTANFAGLPNPNDPDLELADIVDLYFIGDNRVAQTPLLISQHQIWARNHNYWVEELEKKHADWTQDELFEAARALNEAEWQSVVYDEYLKHLLGENAITEFSGYNPTVDPRVINEWTTVAFRFGHDQTSTNQTPLNEDGSRAEIMNFAFVAFTLAEAFRAGEDGVQSADEFDAWIRGMLSGDTQEIDGLIGDGNRNTLFGIPGPGGQVQTVDLNTIDILRGRDHGVHEFNELRQALGLDAYESFDQFGALNGIDADRLQKLKDLYGDDIDMLDSLVGGLMEAKYGDSQLGETFTVLTVMQFENVRDGDKLFYLERFADNPELLEMIESTSMTDILYRVTDIDYLYRDAFLSHSRIVAENGELDGTDGRDLAIGSDEKDVIHTYDDNDDIFAGLGRDTVYAGAGEDIVDGGQHNDKLYGGEDADTFVFGEKSGRDKVMDFNAAEDKLDVSAYKFASYEDVKDNMYDTYKGVFIALDYQNSVKLMGVKSRDLDEDNFILDGQDTYIA